MILRRAWEWLHRRDRDLETAKRRLEEVRGQRPEVERIARELRSRRRDNHFAELVQRALGGGR